MEAVWQDFRYAVRTILGQPLFAVVAVLTLGLGIGANTAIFSVINAVLLRPLPYKDSDRLIRIIQNQPHVPEGVPTRGDRLSTSDFEAWRPQTKTFSHMAAYEREAVTLTGRDEPVRLDGARVSPALFPMLGAQPLVGRVFDEVEEKPGNDAVVILSYFAWERYFNSDSGVVGRSIVLDERDHSVIGIMPADFEFPDREILFWTPFVSPSASVGIPRVIARLQDGVTMTQATTEANMIFGRVHEEYGGLFDKRGPSAGSDASVTLVSLKDEMVEPIRPALIVLIVSVGFVLLIACANVANLMLARASGRQLEIAIRAALGAGRIRLIRQLLTESVLLALAGGVVGTALALWGVQVLAALGPGTIPRLNEIRVDAPAFAYTIALSLLTGVLFGIAPAIRLSRSERIQTLREGVTFAASGFGLLRGNRMQSLLTVSEITLAMVLLIGAGLLINSFLRLSHVSPGYDPENVLTFQVPLPQARYTEAQRLQFYKQMLAQLQALPGIQAAATTNTLPLVPSFVRLVLNIQGRPAPSRPEEMVWPNIRIVSPQYMKTLGLNLLEGRGLSEDDPENGPPALLVNRTFARLYFGEESPVGQRAQLGATPLEIVGVVDDVRHAGLDAETEPEIYLDYRRAGVVIPRGRSLHAMFFTVRTSGDPESASGSIRSLVQRLDPELAIDNVASMEQRLSDSVAGPRFYGVMLGIFAAVALVLAVVGIYGIIARSVSQRRRELGIRIALGADRRKVLGLVIRQGMILTAIGILLGLAGASLVTRYLQNMLFGLSPLDPSTFLGVALLLSTVAILACYLPARRATKVDPIVALRYD